MKIATLAAVMAAASAAFGELIVKDGDMLARLDGRTGSPLVGPMRTSSSFHVLEDVLP